MRLYGRFRDVEDLRRLPVMRLNSGRVVRLQEVVRFGATLNVKNQRST